MLKESLNQVILGIKTIIGKIVDVIHSFLDGTAAKTKTVSGAVTILVLVLLIWDVLQKGTVGVIAYSIDQIKIILTLATDIIKAGGWQLVIVILLLVLWKKEKA